MMNRFLHSSRYLSNELLGLLKKNIIGTPGLGMLYQHLEVFKKVKTIADPYFVTLQKDKHIIGTCCFCSRDTINNGKTLPSFYLRYFTFKSGFRTKKRTTKEGSIKTSKLREEIKEVLSGNGLGERGTGKFFHYAYVDPRNIRSALLCNEFGFDTIRSFSTLIFNRINPKEDFRVKECKTIQETGEVKELLTSFYKGHTMFSFENLLFSLGEYHVIKDEKGNILAGVQATPDSWRILELPGISGKLFLNIFSYLPYLKKLFNKHYQFLTLEGIYYSHGCEKYLEILFESLLAKYQRNSAMVWVDSNSAMYHEIRPLNWGIIDKINHEVKANVIGRFNDFSEAEFNEFKEHPAYISGIDLT